MSDHFERRWTSKDGLCLFARDYPAAGGEEKLPVICLHGLTRNSKDFEDVAPIIAGWGRWVVVSLGGGLILLISALLFVRNLAVLHRGTLAAAARPLYALAVHPPQRVPAALNGFGLWNVLVLVLMLLAYGFPIAQFLIEPSPSAIVHRVR